MKILVCSSGTDYSPKDVDDGLTAGLRALGHDVAVFDLRTRLARSASWLNFNWRRAVRSHPALARPTPADIYYQASLPVVEMALRHIPDWVLFVTAEFIHPDILVMLKRAGVPIGIVLTESPYDDLRQGPLLWPVDIAWTNERSSVPYLRQYHPNVHYLPHAHDPAKHRPDGPADAPVHDVVFVGTLFQERIELLEAVDWTGIDFGLYGEAVMLPSRHRLRRYLRGGITDNARTAALYRNARIGLNLYRRSIGAGRGAPRIAHAESLNPRAYELAACGAFHLSEYREEVGEVFGNLVPTFNGPGELRYLTRWYLEKTGQRRRMAAQLPATVAGHTWRQRAEIITAGLRATTPRVPEKLVAGVAG